MGIDIIPGVLVICTFVMMLTGRPAENGLYTGAAFEGIGLLPALGEKLQGIISPLFGLTSAEGIAVPITALGSSGASLSIVTRLVKEGLANQHDVAVFTAMCMCMSGYLSTHVAMMNALGYSNLTGKAIACHTIGGLLAGVSAHLIYTLIPLVV
jgi:spore maturation protein SpmB